MKARRLIARANILFASLILAGAVGIAIYFQFFTTPQYHCIRDHQITLFIPGQKTLHVPLVQQLQPMLLRLKNTTWRVAALKTEHIGDIVGDLATQTGHAQFPLVAFIQDDQLREYILRIGCDGDIFLASIESLLKNQLNSLDKLEYGIKIDCNEPVYLIYRK